MECTKSVVASQLNEWTKSIDSDGAEIWQSTSDFVPVRSQSFSTIRIGRSMTAEFDFLFGGRTNDPNPDAYEMFFRVGFDSNLGNGCSGQGSRYPSLWLASGSNTLHVSVSDNNSCQPSYSLANYGTISVGVWYHIAISYNATSLWVEVSVGAEEQSSWSQSWLRDDTIRDHLGEEADIWWMSGKYGPTEYNRGNGTFRNITFTSADFQYTAEPTALPTAVPTAAPTIEPTVIPTPHPTEGVVLSATTTTSHSIESIPSSSTSDGAQTVTGFVDGGQQHVVWGDPLDSVDMATVVWIAAIASCLCCGVAVSIIWVGFKRQFKRMRAELQPQDTDIDGSSHSGHSTLVMRRVATESGRHPSLDIDVENGHHRLIGDGRVGDGHGDFQRVQHSDDLDQAELTSSSQKGQSELEEDGVSVLNALGIQVSPKHNWPEIQRQIELEEDSISETNLEPRDVPRVVSTDNLKNHEMAEGFGSAYR